MSDAPNARRIVNRADLAGLCSVSLPTVDTWLRKGCPVIERGSKGKPAKFDSAAVINWRIRSAVNDAVAGFQGEDGKVSKDEADRRKAVANAITAEVEADEALKSVVSRFDAESVVADFCQSLRSSLSNAGSKIASRTATVSNPAEIHEVCRNEINRAFRSAEADLAERWTRDPEPSGDDGGED